MIYKEPEEITKEETAHELLGTSAEASEALIRAALWIDDPEWLETLLLKSLKDSREDVRDAALLGLGHMVRLQKFVSEESVESIVQSIQPFLSDPKLKGRAENALDDIDTYRPGSKFHKQETITFGIRAKKQELDAVAKVLGEVLGVEFILRKSSLRGGDYCSAEVPEGTIILQGNHDLLPEDEPFAPGWPIEELILYLYEEDDYSWQKQIHALETTQRIGVTRLE